MPDRLRRHLRYFWPPGHSWGPWHHFAPPYGPMGGWGRWREPSIDEEKELLDGYIETLKEELEAAEAYRKELETAE